MKTRPDISTHFDPEKASSLNAPPEEVRKEVYPQITDRFKTVMLWFSVLFLIAIVWIQQYSGYN